MPTAAWSSSNTASQHQIIKWARGHVPLYDFRRGQSVAAICLSKIHKAAQQARGGFCQLIGGARWPSAPLAFAAADAQSPACLAAPLASRDGPKMFLAEGVAETCRRGGGYVSALPSSLPGARQHVPSFAPGQYKQLILNFLAGPLETRYAEHANPNSANGQLLTSPVLKASANSVRIAPTCALTVPDLWQQGALRVARGKGRLVVQAHGPGKTLTSILVQPGGGQRPCAAPLVQIGVPRHIGIATGDLARIFGVLAECALGEPPSLSGRSASLLVADAGLRLMP